NLLIATLLNPKYQEGIFKKLGVPPNCEKVVIDILAGKCAQLGRMDPADHGQGDLQLSLDNLSEPDSFNLLKHLKQPPLEASYNVLQSQDDKVPSYLQNNHPVAKGKHIIEYWKVVQLRWKSPQAGLLTQNALKRQIISGNFPKLDKIVLKYLSIPASSASVERVFSHSGHLKCPTGASLGSKTISHLTCLKEWLNNEAPPF
ncbi:hypothetical protein O181_121953, partial [Austropuccinia psidii MF-1]|nr:hypothetical protein [Austropuccinia psidii MF-1]